MQTLQVLKENKAICILTWPKIELADQYILEGMTDIFFYEPIQVLTENHTVFNKKNNKQYISYRINYICQNENGSVSIDLTNDITLQYNFEEIILNAIQSFEGGAISFVSDKHYDKYKLYLLSDSNKCIETEDCIVSSSHIKQGNTYYVEAYTKNEDDTYTLSAVSDEWKCHFEEPKQVANPIISIIVPAYNASSFLSRTVDSILLSSFKEIELILVDDGSTDNTGKICDWYAQYYSVAKTFHQENGGLSSARNKGMDNAIGEFIAFVDSDDIVHPYMYEKLYKGACEENSDVAIAQTITRDDFNKHHLVFKTKHNRISMHSYKEVMAARNNQNNIHFVVVWNKIMRRNIALKIRFMDRFLCYEDIAYTNSIYSYAKNFLFLNDAYYIWDKRKRKTVGTLSTSVSKFSTEILWKCNIQAYAAPLYLGNTSDSEIVSICKLDILQLLLDKYKEHKWGKTLDCIFKGMIKYYVNEYKLPTNKLLSSTNEKDKNRYNAWKEIQSSNVCEYDGIGDIPKEYC